MIAQYDICFMLGYILNNLMTNLALSNPINSEFESLEGIEQTK